MVVFSCSKQEDLSIERLDDSNPELQIQQRSTNQSFESMLNEIYTSKLEKPIVPYIHSINYSYSSRDGISEVERNRIISEIVSIDYFGQTPYIIDVNPIENKVEVVFDSQRSDDCCNGFDPLPEEYEYTRPCENYDERYNAAFDCGNGLDYFDGLTNVSALNGGLNGFTGELKSGTDCDGQSNLWGRDRFRSNICTF